MGKMKSKRISLFLLIGIVLCSTAGIPVYAVSGETKQAIDPSSFLEWDDGAIVSKSMIPAIDVSAMSVTAQTTGLRGRVLHLLSV